MKIAINATFLNNQPTGVGNFTYEISKAITALHQETIIFSSVIINGASPKLQKLTNLKIQGSSKIKNNLLRLFYINTLLLLRCIKEKIDILYCPIMEFPFIRTMPTIVHIHDLHPIYFPSQFKLAAKRFKISLKLIKAIDWIIVPSEYTKRELLRYVKIKENKIDVVFNAYNNKLFNPQPESMKKEFFFKYPIGRKYILFVGSLFEYKNVKALINSFNMIKNIIPHNLVIVGRKDTSLEPLQNDKRIFYMDYVPLEDLPKFYSFADLFVYPSLSEGFGIAPLEAMACGTPVIASNKASLPEVIGDAAVLIEPSNVNKLSETIVTILKSQQLRNELRDKGLRHVKNFSWNKTANRILQICEKVYNKNKRK